MATKTPVSCVMSIGETAGVVWSTLSKNGPMTMAKLVKAVGEPRHLWSELLCRACGNCWETVF